MPEIRTLGLRSYSVLEQPITFGRFPNIAQELEMDEALAMRRSTTKFGSVTSTQLSVPRKLATLITKKLVNTSWRSNKIGFVSRAAMK